MKAKVLYINDRMCGCVCHILTKKHWWSRWRFVMDGTTPKFYEPYEVRVALKELGDAEMVATESFDSIEECAKKYVSRIMLHYVIKDLWT